MLAYIRGSNAIELIAQNIEEESTLKRLDDKGMETSFTDRIKMEGLVSPYHDHAFRIVFIGKEPK